MYTKRVKMSSFHTSENVFTRMKYKIPTNKTKCRTKPMTVN